MTLQTGNKICVIKAFTLIELLISVAILGFGLVIVIQSYITSANALNISQNYISAMQLARDKLTEIELAAYEKKGLFPGDESGSGTEKIGSRNFNWETQVKEIYEPDYLAEKLVEVCVKLNWNEAGKPKDALLSTYLPRFKEEQ
jgi:type II secretion system protein I